MHFDSSMSENTDSETHSEANSEDKHYSYIYNEYFTYHVKDSTEQPTNKDISITYDWIYTKNNNSDSDAEANQVSKKKSHQAFVCLASKSIDNYIWYANSLFLRNYNLKGNRYIPLFHLTIAYQHVLKLSQWIWWYLFFQNINDEDIQKVKNLQGTCQKLYRNIQQLFSVNVQNKTNGLKLLEHWKCVIEFPYWSMSILNSDLEYDRTKSFKNDLLLFMIDRPCHNFDNMYQWHDWYSLELIHNFDKFNHIIEYQPESIVSFYNEQRQNETLETKKRIQDMIVKIWKSLLLKIDASENKLKYSFSDLAKVLNDRDVYFLKEPETPLELYYYKPRRKLLHDIDWDNHSISVTEIMSIILQKYCNIILPVARFFLMSLQEFALKEDFGDKHDNLKNNLVKTLFDAKVVAKITHPFDEYDNDWFATHNPIIQEFKEYLLKKFNSYNSTLEEEEIPKKNIEIDFGMHEPSQWKTLAGWIDVFFSKDSV